MMDDENDLSLEEVKAMFDEGEPATSYAAIADYLDGKMTLGELHGWLQAHTWGDQPLDMIDARALLILAEATTEQWPEDAVKEELQAIVGSHGWGGIAVLHTGDPSVVITNCSVTGKAS